jgi:hypothetical protein
LSSVLEDLDSPPSSLPTASSDIDIDTYPSHSSRDEASEDIEAEQDNMKELEHTTKQHWSGLPPSSPPPPSSPLLRPSDAELEATDEETDDLERGLLLATSDTDYSYLDSERTTDAGYSEDELAMYFNLNSFNALSSTPDQSHSDSQDHQCNPSSDMDVFEQFTNHHVQSDDSQTGQNMDISMDQELDPIIQNGLVDFDFTEFWESMKPLVADSANVDTDSNSYDLALDFGMSCGDSQEMNGLDHTKLAEEVHALFSGCLM